MVWLKDLIIEMGFENMITKSTSLIDDNKAANILNREDMVTLGNRFYIKIKEGIGIG